MKTLRFYLDFVPGRVLLSCLEDRKRPAFPQAGLFTACYYGGVWETAHVVKSFAARNEIVFLKRAGLWELMFVGGSQDASFLIMPKSLAVPVPELRGGG